jgi:hypothetical protein
MWQSTTLVRAFWLAALMAGAGILHAQSSLVLSSGGVAPGGSIVLNLTLSSTAGNRPAGLQWTLSYPAANVSAWTVAEGPALAAAGKTITCAGASGVYTCLAVGMNAYTISDGVVATVSVSLATNATTTVIGLGNTLGVSPTCEAISIVPTSGTVTVAIQTATPPTVYIDSLASGATIGGTVTVSGWAIDSATVVGAPIASVQIDIDGIPVGNASYGSLRPDVCAAFPGRPGCPNVGFSFQLNTMSLSVGSHTITAIATDAAPTSFMGSYSVNVTVAVNPTVFIDSISSGSTASGTVTLSGWAVDSRSAVGSVQVQVDGSVIGNAAYGTPRADVCQVFPSPFGCPNVGFTYQLDTASLGSGAHTITAVATDTDINPDTGSFSVSVTVPPGTSPPSAFVDSLAAGAAISGTVTISGWAIDSMARIGTGISSVLVLVDYQVVGTAAYGTSRPDVCTVFPGRTGCPNVGFTFALDTAPLSSGNHIITVLATDIDATPETGSYSVAVKK